MSTVLDVAVCLLLIGAAIATFSFGSAPSESTAVDADPDAAMLATVTGSVPTDGTTVHATHAEHLAGAALVSGTVGGEPIADDDYARAVLDEVEPAVADRVAVTARWEPYPNATLRGEIRAGSPPPADATVAATTLSVPLVSDPLPEHTFEAVATALAEEVIEWLFPTDRARQALVDRRTARETAERYRTTADALEVDVEDRLEKADSEGANRRLAAELADRLEPELRDRFETPRAAAEGTSRDVEVVVRRWEP